MGIEDIQISEELETNAPSIRYRGDEGPKSPQEEKMMMLIEKLMSQGMGQEEAIQMAQQIMAQDEQQQMAQQQMPPPQMAPQGMPPPQMAPQGMPPRQMAAFGGIMGLDGRRQYGFGSSLKKRLRKLIPNEIAKVAEVAAPFVAPFNPLAAGLMSGIGGFDRTGRIGSSIKSGLMNYGMGNLARVAGGAGFQGGLKAPNTGSGFGSYFTSPTSGQQIFGTSKQATDLGQANRIKNNGLDQAQKIGGSTSTNYDLGVEDVLNDKQGGFLDRTLKKISDYVPTSFADLKDPKKAMGGIGLLSAAGGAYTAFTADEAIDEIMDRGGGMDVSGIRTEVIEAFNDQTGEKLKALRIKYPYLGTQRSKNQAAMGKAMGGRIGRAEGGLMDLGGMEKDYRAEGGFVPIGEYEKKDDVPARLSVNEFVFTADAVRNAGGGDIDRGAEVMENVMKNLEQGGQMSEESQGMQGAREMFQTSQRLGEIL